MPGLRIIREDESLTYKGDGFEIYYRRIPNKRRGNILEKHKKRGQAEANLNSATQEMMEYCILGWKGFYYLNQNKERVDLPFDSGIIGAIPDEVLADVVELCGANADQGQVEAKNSLTTSASSTITEASPAASAE